MAKDRPAKIVSKKHLARQERERRETRIITYSAVGVLLIVVGLIVYGILSQTVLMAASPIVKVNGSVLTTAQFQARVKVARQQLINQYFQYEQYAAMFGIDPSTDPTFSNYLTQITTQLNDPTTIGNQVINDAKDAMEIEQYAQANGITVTSAEIDAAIRDAFSYYPNGTPTPTATTTPFSTSTWSPLQMTLVPPTSTPTLLPTDTITPTLEFTPTLAPTDTPTATYVPTAIITAAPTVPTASPTPYTTQVFATTYQKAVAYYATLGMTEADFRQYFFIDKLFRQKVEDKIEANFAHVQEQVWARHILVADQATANQVRALLVAGGSWTDLAAQYSTDTGTKTNGGDLGWFGKGQMVAEFETAAFGLQIGEISQPVQSTYGWHVIQVLGHENRPLSDSQYTTARDSAFTTWITNQLSTAKVTLYSYWSSRVPSSPTISEVSTQMAETQQATP